MLDFTKPMMELETGRPVLLVRNAGAQALITSAGIIKAVLKRDGWATYQENLANNTYGAGLGYSGAWYESDGSAVSVISGLHEPPQVVNAPDIETFRQEYNGRIAYVNNMTVAYSIRGSRTIEMATALCRPNENFVKRLGAYHAISNFHSLRTVIVPRDVLDSILFKTLTVRPVILNFNNGQ